jgi:alpha-glucosidase
VPLPWESGNASNGFNNSGNAWLPQPESYANLSRDLQENDPSSTLNLFKQALGLRKQLKLGEGSFDWLSVDDVLSYQNGTLTVVHNFSDKPFDLEGKILLSSAQLANGQLSPNDTAWVLA